MAANKLLYAHGENVSDTAPNSIGAADTSITVNTISKWNVNGGPIVINRGASDQEYAIASSVSGSSLTISLRGAYGSTAVSHNANATIESVPFAHQWNDMLATILNLFRVADGNIDITLLGTAEYVADTGAANAYVATLVPALASYTAGTVVRFKATNANTGASTLNVNALGVKSIKRIDGTALMQGDIVASQVCVCVYDGTNFILLTPAVLSAISYVATASWVNGIKITTAATGNAPLISPDGPSGDANIQLKIKGKGTSGVNVQALSPVVFTLTDGATIATDTSLGQVATVTIAGNRTMSNPTNMVDGQLLEYQITQDATGSRTITWGAGFSFGTSGAPTLTTAASKTDRLIFRYNATKAQWLYGGIQLGF